MDATKPDRHALNGLAQIGRIGAIMGRARNRDPKVARTGLILLAWARIVLIRRGVARHALDGWHKIGRIGGKGRRAVREPTLRVNSLGLCPLCLCSNTSDQNRQSKIQNKMRPYSVELRSPRLQQFLQQQHLLALPLLELRCPSE